MSFRKNKESSEERSIIVVRLRKLREIHNESQEQLAEAIHVPKSKIQNIEQSKSELSLKLAGKIAKHYNVSTDYICGMTDDLVAPRNILDTLCDYISITQHSMRMQIPHEVPFISISKPLYKYLKIRDKAQQLKEQGVPDEVIDAWVGQEKQKAADSLQKATDDIVNYALLSDRDIASDEVMALLEKSFNESNF